MTTRKSGLGRGLEALIPKEAPERVVGDPEFRLIGIDEILPNPDQPRSRFDDEVLEELSASIREVGVLQPIVVTEGDEIYVLVAGERRWRAAKLAGLESIPAVVRAAGADSSLVESLVENVQRQDLTPLEEAHAFSQLLENFGMSQDDIARRVGKSRPTISNTIRLLQLPGPVQTMVDGGLLTAGAARALLGLDDEKYAIYLAEKASKDDWSVRQVEEAVRARREMESPERAASRAVREIRPVEIIELENRLGDQLGTRVRIKYKDEKGRVEIRFDSVEQLEQIYRSFLGGS